MKPMLTILISLAFWLAGTTTQAQLPLVDLPRYSMINYSANHLHIDSSSIQWERMVKRWHHVASTGAGNFNILHIGASHVQAGVLSNTIRTRVMKAYPGLVASRGLLFPYSAAAKCNNPPDYRIHCKENMLLTRCVYKEHDQRLGACGIAVTAHDTLTDVQVVMNEPAVDYATVRVVVIGRSEQGVVPRLSIRTPTASSSIYSRRSIAFLFCCHARRDSSSP